MSDNLHTNWRSTESEPVEQKPTEPKNEPKKQEVRVRNVPSPKVTHIPVEPSHISLRLAAVTGIGLVVE